MERALTKSLTDLDIKTTRRAAIASFAAKTGLVAVAVVAGVAISATPAMASDKRNQTDSDTGRASDDVAQTDSD